MKQILVFVPDGLNITATVNLINSDSNLGVHCSYVTRVHINRSNLKSAVLARFESLASTCLSTTQSLVVFVPLSHKNLIEWNIYFCSDEYYQNDIREIACVGIDISAVYAYFGCALVSKNYVDNLNVLEDNVLLEEIEEDLVYQVGKKPFREGSLFELYTDMSIVNNYPYVNKFSLLTSSDFRFQTCTRASTSLATPLMERINWLVW